MTDIVDRLTRATDLLETGQYDIINTSMVKEAAAEIERLRAAVAAEREACAMIADEWGKRKDQTTDTAFVPGACHGERYAADGIYNAIRARGKT